MVITCENCESKFRLDESLIKESGSKVRCSNCQHIFTAYRTSAAEEISPTLDLQEGDLGQPDESSEEPLDFDLFGSEEGQDEEGFSLEDFGFEEESAEQKASEEISVSEEEITAEDLGFEQAPEPTSEPVSEEKGEQEIDLDGLSLEEETPAEDVPPVAEQAEEEKIKAGEEISFEDLSLEEEPVAEGVPEPTEELILEDEPEEESSFEDLSVEKVEVDEEPTEEWPAEEETAAIPEDAGVTLPEGLPIASVEEGEETEEGIQDEIPPPPIVEQLPERRRISMPLMVALIIVLVGGGAYAAYTILKSQNIEIPFLESLAGAGKSETIDPGNIHISLLENLIAGEFVESKSAGRLFVVKGKIRSNYPATRNFIRLKGVIYLKDGKIAQDRIVYCGNVLSDTDLQILDRQTINKRLGNRFGQNKVNFRVPNGKVLPFMVVFFGLPEELGEFSVEVVGSIPA